MLWPQSHDLMIHCDTGVFYKDPSVTWDYEEKEFRGKKNGFPKGGVVTHLDGLTSGWSIPWVVSQLGGLSPGWSLRWVVFGSLFIRVVYDLGGLSSGWSMTWVAFHQGGL